MELDEAKEKFIQAWGTLGSNWGINRTMAQIHALLLVSPEALTADAIMETLKISRGNTNVNLHALMDWGLVHKELKMGERKEYFVAEKNMLEIVKRIIIQRKKKELEPLLKVLDDVSVIDGDSPDALQFTKMIRDIQLFSRKADSTLDTLVQTDSVWLIGSFFKMVK